MSGVLRAVYASALVMAVVGGILLFLDARQLADFAFTENDRTLEDTQFFKETTLTLNKQFYNRITEIHESKAEWINNITERDQFIGIGRFFTVGFYGDAKTGGPRPLLRVGRALNMAPTFSIVFDRAKAKIVDTPERCDGAPTGLLFTTYVPIVNLTGLCEYLLTLDSRPRVYEVQKRLLGLSKIIPVEMVRIDRVKYIFIGDDGNVASDLNDYIDNPFPADIVEFFVGNTGLCTGMNPDCNLPFQGQIEILRCKDLNLPVLSKRIEPDEWNNLTSIGQYCIQATQETPVGKLFFYFSENIYPINFFIGTSVLRESVDRLVEGFYLLPNTTRLNLIGSITKDEFQLQTFWSSLTAFQFEVGGLTVSLWTAFIILVVLACLDLVLWLRSGLIRRPAPKSQETGPSRPDDDGR